MSAEEQYSEFHRLLVRYLAGELDAVERTRFMALVDQDPALRKELDAYQGLWESSGQVDRSSAYDLDAEWSQMKDLLPGFETRSLFRTLYRVAAILVIGLFIGLGGFYALRLMSTTQVVAGDERLEHLLPDGSHIWLNHDSKLRYKTAFNGSHRWVKLKGEAFFEVSRDTLRPFVIEAGQAMVEVLGTSFNVNAYQANTIVEITVESGVVALSSKVGQEEQIVLKAGNSGSYDPGREELLLVPKSNPNNFSWKSGKLIFDGSTLEEVARVMEHVYRIHIDIPDGKLAACTLTASFSDQGLESVLEVIVATLDLEVKREADRIVLTGEACTE